MAELTVDSIQAPSVAAQSGAQEGSAPAFPPAADRSDRAQEPSSGVGVSAPAPRTMGDDLETLQVGNLAAPVQGSSMTTSATASASSQQGNARMQRAGGGGLNTPLARVRAIMKLPASSQVRILPGIIARLSTESLKKQDVRVREKTQRKAALRKVSRIARPTLAIFFILILMLAVAFDLLDLFKEAVAQVPVLGWLINVVIGGLKALTIGLAISAMERRIARITEGVKRVSEHERSLRNVADRRYPRVVALALEARLGRHLPAADPNASIGSFKQVALYQSRILINYLVMMVLEALPITDLAPISTVRAINAYRKQQIEYRKARQIIVTCQLLIDKLDQQWDIELRYLSVCLRLAQRAYLIARVRSSADALIPLPRIPEPVRRAVSRGPPPRGMTDIGRPSLSPSFAT